MSGVRLSIIILIKLPWLSAVRHARWEKITIWWTWSISILYTRDGCHIQRPLFFILSQRRELKLPVPNDLWHTYSTGRLIFSNIGKFPATRKNHYLHSIVSTGEMYLPSYGLLMNPTILFSSRLDNYLSFRLECIKHSLPVFSWKN